MVYTVTFNPSIDYIMTVSPFYVGETNRTSSEYYTAGGKGINVALVLKNMGVGVKAIAFTAGWTGEEIERRLRKTDLDCDFIRVDGESRINVKIKSEEETEINGRGADVDEKAFAKLLEKLQALKSGDVLALSGNATRGTTDDIYVRIMQALQKGVRVTVDAHGQLLKSVLPMKPFLIKPNLDELCGFFGKKIKKKHIAKYAVMLRDMGAENVIVSLGGEGAVMASSDGMVYDLKPPIGTLVNSTGAGDSLVAGFITRYLETSDVIDSFKFAVAAGSACAFAQGFPTREETEKLYNELS